MRYNPFAGNFTEDMAFNLLVTYSDNSIKLHITEPTVVCGYSGYGSNVTSKSFAGRIDEYNMYQEKLNNGSVKGKEKKQIKNEIKNINGELNMCQEELNKMLDIIKNNL